MVMDVKGDNVGEEVSSLEGEILDNKVQRIVGVLDTGDGDIPNLEHQPIRTRATPKKETAK